ncbi:MAG: IS21 family transposase [Acidobacteria bacterium]|nr:IS21 family transposase [Acidobacteriota bacterium]
MLKKEDFVVIQALVKRGMFLCDIARELGVHPKTVRRALERGGAPTPPRRGRPSLLRPFLPVVDRLLAEGVWNAVVILRELQGQGYRGSASILREYIHPKRALRPGKATVRFETEPGRQLQSDWGCQPTRVAGEEVRAHFIVNTLGYSRRFHFWGTDREDAEHTYEGMVRSFEWFGGVPGEVLVDNQKSAVLEHPRESGAVFNPRFLDLAGHYGFQPRACRPARARTKGKDERMVGYLKQHFFVRYREFESFAHLNQLAEQWLREEADVRVHGTTREVVAERFAREVPHLHPLPQRRYDTSYWELRQVAWDSYLDVRGNRYSVPASLVGRRVTIRISLDDVLTVYDGESLVARHRLQPRDQGWVTVPEHHVPLWEQAVTVQRRPLRVYEEAARWS